MGRAPRIEYEGAVYHVMCRGNRQEPVFRDDRDNEMFLDTLEEVCGRCGWRVHAFVLMGNHYHLLLETPHANLVDGMGRASNLSRFAKEVETATDGALHRLRKMMK